MLSLRFSIAVACLCCSPTAFAEEAPIPYRVQSSGSGECAPATFASKLEQRSPRLRPASASERLALSFELNVERHAEKLSGRMSVHEIDGSETTRAVEGVTCDEVLSALALIAVVLVDPNALGESSSSPAAPAPAPVAEARIQPTLPVGPPRHWRFGAGVNGGIEGAVSPDVAVVAALQLEALLGGDGASAPRLTVAFERSAGNTVSTPSGDAHFVWTAARATGCLVRFPRSGPLAVRPCLFMDAGMLQGTGERTFRASSARLTWISLGALGHAELWPVPRLALGLDAGFAAPFVRDRFYFDPGDDASTVRLPRLGLTLRTGLTLFFH